MELIKNHWLEILGLIIGYIGLIVPIFQYLNQRKLEEKDKRFLNYHKLIKDIVEPESPSKEIKLDRQIAAIFELRNFPVYFPLTERILSDLNTQWENVADKRLLREIGLTLEYLTYKNKIWILRIFIKKP